jgi:exosortase
LRYAAGLKDLMLPKIKISFGFQISLGLILAGAILWFYWPILVGLTKALLACKDYSFGLLLPLVGTYITYLKCPQIRRGPWQPSCIGLTVMGLPLIFYMAVKVPGKFYSTRISFVMFTAGIILLTGGWEILRQLAFPILLLVLKLPLLGIITSNLTLPLQRISSRLAANFLRFLDYPQLLNGNVIDLGVRQLHVVASCSKLRYAML